MYVLRIEHAVPDYDRWRMAFDSDPVGRARGGVRRHRVQRAVGDAQQVTIDLEFDTLEAAEAFHMALLALWEGPGAGFVRNPEAHIVEVVETREYDDAGG